MKRTIFALILAGALLLPAFSALADTDSHDMYVYAYVHTDTTVTVDAATLAFGRIDRGYDAYASVDIHVTCAPSGRGYTLYADSGLNYGADISGDRAMSDGLSDYLSYSLYQEAGLINEVIGGSGISGTGTGSEQTVTLYGWVPSSSQPADGNFSDTVVITVEYDL